MFTSNAWVLSGSSDLSFEEFLFDDLWFGSASVRFVLERFKDRDSGLWNVRISQPEVSSLSVFDDDGNDVTERVPEEDLRRFREQVLEQFHSVADDVRREIVSCG